MKDHRQFISAMLNTFNPRPHVRRVIECAYNSTWDGKPFEDSSDGISWIVDMDGDYGIKHPVGVGHDFLYRAGRLSPWWRLKWDERDGKAWADGWYLDALADFRHPYRARIHWLGLRWFAGWAWQANRDRDPETLRKLVIGGFGRRFPPLDDVI